MMNDDNQTTWWTLMKNVDYLKDYVGTACIIEPWNPPTTWRNVSYLTMSNFDAYRDKLKEFQRWPLSLLNVRHRWIMALVMGLMEDIPWHFKRVSTNIPLTGMSNDDNETAYLGAKLGAKREAKLGAKQGTKTRSKHGRKIGSKNCKQHWEPNWEQKLGAKLRAKAGNKTGSNTGKKTGSKMGSKSGSKTRRKTGIKN